MMTFSGSRTNRVSAIGTFLRNLPNNLKLNYFLRYQLFFSLVVLHVWRTFYIFHVIHRSEITENSLTFLLQLISSLFKLLNNLMTNIAISSSG